MPKRVTMADVARAAGVSLMTVSRVVNDKGGASKATRRRVQDVIERLGYRPSSIARGLATKRTGTLGVVVPDNSNTFFSEVARAAEHIAYAANHNIFLGNTEEDPQREVGILRSFEEKRVDGVLLCSSRLADDTLRAVLAWHPAIVLLNRRLEGDPVSAVLIDDETGGQRATKHLLQSGHRAVGFLAGPPASYSGRQRAAGYCAALEEARLTYDPAWARSCSPEIEGGREAARALLAHHPELTALFCYNDLVAVGALKACAELGRQVPEDMAIVGFDDIPLAALVTPSLTTCRVPRYELGSRAMELLLSQVNGHAGESRVVVVRPELVVRASAP
ncbi:MAG: Catabolite control protein A [Anaerolineales bacterium]|nr:Catabolite control protein A [Anaerolineales bacterium]